ncbi:MAG: FAD-dependent oxidoreductase [archaeon]|jgi:thioredoxin reductase (NADPH)
MTDYDVAIIGAGPAGLTAGIYCARYGLKTIILEKGLIGGTATWANSIQNYPGFEDISGMELMSKFRVQAEKVGVQIELDTVNEVKESGKEKQIILSDKIISVKTIIVAVGAKSKWLKVKGEKEFLNKGVHFCATCDGPMYNGKEVVVIGSDSRAAEEAIYLATVTKKVTLISSKKELSAENAELQKLKEKGVQIMLDAQVLGFEGSQMLEKIAIKSKGKEIKMNCSGAFIYIGSEPNTTFVNVKKDELGRIIVSDKMETSNAGIFAAGDCIKKELNQISTCVGEGAMAAHSASKFVQDKN